LDLFFFVRFLFDEFHFIVHVDQRKITHIFREGKRINGFFDEVGFFVVFFDLEQFFKLGAYPFTADL
jgi:PP-loop superfamily ATP-utilizing enzyme